jgi:FKBP-type peptidyl-prolyl cis-trans isomerase 2
MSEGAIQYGSTVTLHYTLSLPDGWVVESTRGGEPAVVGVGRGEMLPGLEQRLLGLRAGERARFEIPCVEAYGPAGDPQLQSLAREAFPPDMPLEPGLVIGFETPNGAEVPGTIVEVSPREVIVDFAHPLAGHDLVFEVEILAVSPPRS